MLVGWCEVKRYACRMKNHVAFALCYFAMACAEVDQEETLAAAAFDQGPGTAVNVSGAASCSGATPIGAGWTRDPKLHTVPSGVCFAGEARKFYRMPPSRAALIWTPRYLEADLQAVADCGADAPQSCRLPNATGEDYEPDKIYLRDRHESTPLVISTSAYHPSEFRVTLASIEAPQKIGTCAAPTPLNPATVVVEQSSDGLELSTGCKTDVRAVTLPPRSTLRTYGRGELHACCGSQLSNLTDQPSVALLSGYGGAPYAVQPVALPSNLCCADATRLEASDQKFRIEIDQPGLVGGAGCGADHRWFQIEVPFAEQISVTVAGLGDTYTGLQVWLKDACDGQVLDSAGSTNPQQIVFFSNRDSLSRTVYIGVSQYGRGIVANYADVSIAFHRAI